MPVILWATTPVARKPHTCSLCSRTIDPGERYRRTRLVWDDAPYTFKECDHCAALVRVTDVMEWADEDSGYTTDDVHEWEPRTVRDLRLKVQFMRRWRRRDGSLYPVPVSA